MARHRDEGRGLSLSLSLSLSLCIDGHYRPNEEAPGAHDTEGFGRSKLTP